MLWYTVELKQVQGSEHEIVQSITDTIVMWYSCLGTRYNPCKYEYKYDLLKGRFKQNIYVIISSLIDVVLM